MIEEMTSRRAHEVSTPTPVTHRFSGSSIAR
jgi:hypothetical protein